jgi:hypothetical protein
VTEAVEAAASADVDHVEKTLLELRRKTDAASLGTSQAASDATKAVATKLDEVKMKVRGLVDSEISR